MASSEQPVFPLKTRQTARLLNGTHTEVMVTGFHDKILVIVTQYGRIGSLIYVTVDSLSPTVLSVTPSTTTNIKFLFGSMTLLYQLYASHLATVIAADNPMDGRSVVVGLALKKSGDDDEVGNKEVFEEVVSMVKECRVW
ncbi:20358_t:CDS:2 [Funneliformis geosporum]|uniref:12705_t:CDS:1 n=1 Tax=Funneliformis geosporum TaxID=1117311 RepID=A0A9W4SMR0_9GLOM|nr:20358_t:CDS:2 [Funneliformis geosporum]CAI2174032.1 12705_t:CDS:2 [Funneliformis geosporum]